jgi:hypothetical protein
MKEKNHISQELNVFSSRVLDPDPYPFLGISDPDPLFRGTYSDPDPSIIKQKW